VDRFQPPDFAFVAAIDMDFAHAAATFHEAQNRIGHDWIDID
jgi:hypothetical protein